ncbi:hypothetical protein BU24DRAFT_16466 [Aaosphaeria arxii CBS 175.79]|uniref:Uncharacterized protein n=1 Tax=Aaosphaeria arxii CBS 175.79 TaxID=1450172 RepID=A0A6A5Y7A9_9PLEO|nr:uncharacterized protein BU24DRAFT_16466 [Aaosphaeria arxii CBS 175.79]KAF2021179.1 hypothetical protein BU24DRAFT_16466 [Aaosphaeria arxii CBS 175.79]
MGGKAFAQAGPNGTPLNVPRMPLEVYRHFSLDFHARLATIFRQVRIPRDAPGKLDFGDIDFLVEGPLCPWTPESLHQLLGAARRLDCGNTHSYAVPYPDAPDQYVQVDVEIAPGSGTPDRVALFEWECFMKSDGDLLQIIGICHRSLGLICNDKGLHVRVAEIEPYDKKKALIFLTRSPQEAIQFYGMDPVKYAAGFETDIELFSWICGGRFVAYAGLRDREEKANDRARQRKRPLYSKFVEEYVPSLADRAVESEDTLWTRQQVLSEALDTFQKRDVYDSMIQEHLLRERELELWQRIREALPVEGSSLALVLKALRRWVKFQKGQPYIGFEPLLEDQPKWSCQLEDEVETIAWVKQNWMEAKSLEKARAVSVL